VGVLWLVDGQFYRDPNLARYYEEKLLYGAKNEPPKKAPVKGEKISGATPENEPAKALPPNETRFVESYRSQTFPMIPPPNSEVVAVPRADLELRDSVKGERAVQKTGPIERAEGVHQELEREEGRAVTVGELMSRSVVTVGLTTTVEEALTTMKQGHFHHLPVVDAEGRVAGMVSDRDLFARSGPLEKRMVKRVLTASPQTRLQEAAKALTANQIHSLVIINEEREPVGMVTSFDLLNYLATHPALQLFS